jgi:hypothetical protein
MLLTIKQAAQILDVDPDISNTELKKVWRSKAKTCHPDLFPGDQSKEKEFKKYSQAYETMIGYHELARSGEQMNEEILDDDFEFILSHVSEEKRQAILNDLEMFHRKYDHEE